MIYHIWSSTLKNNGYDPQKDQIKHPWQEYPDRHLPSAYCLLWAKKTSEDTGSCSLSPLWMWFWWANYWAHSSDLPTPGDSTPSVLARRHQALGASCRTTADSGLPSSHRPEDLARPSHQAPKKKKKKKKKKTKKKEKKKKIHILSVYSHSTYVQPIMITLWLWLSHIQACEHMQCSSHVHCHIIQTEKGVETETLRERERQRKSERVRQTDGQAENEQRQRHKQAEADIDSEAFT